MRQIKSTGIPLRTRVLRNWQCYVFLLLPVAYLLIFKYIPMLGVQIAFKKYSFKDGIWGSPWVGLKNFTRFLNNRMFVRTFVNTIRLSLYSILAGFPFPILFALALNSVERLRLRKTLQTITYIPHFISTVVLVGIINQLFHNTTGLYGVLGRLLTGEKPADLFASPTVFVNLYVWSGVWKSFGWSSILYLACLGNVSAEQMEAAEIDGANRLQRVWNIELPALTATIVIQLILRMGSVMNIGFEKVILMQNDLNLRMSEVISTYVYKQSLGATTRADYSYSTAIDLFNALINTFFIVCVNKISSRVSDVSLW